jgi:hypothetical protein
VTVPSLRKRPARVERGVGLALGSAVARPLRSLEHLALALEESLEEIGAILGHEAPNHLRTVIHPRMAE